MATILNILQHALGRDEYGRRKPGRTDDYRNHFCAGEDDLPICRDAAAQGLMTEHAPRAISGGDPIFTVTKAGVSYITEHSPAPPKVSRSKARYLRWHNSALADLGMSFGEWLKAGAP